QVIAFAPLGCHLGNPTRGDLADSHFRPRSSRILSAPDRGRWRHRFTRSPREKAMARTRRLPPVAITAMRNFLARHSSPWRCAVLAVGFLLLAGLDAASADTVSRGGCQGGPMPNCV